MKRLKPCAIVIFWGLALLCLTVGCSSLAAAGEFLVISDIHFNPFHGLDKQQFAELASLPAKAWPGYLRALEQPAGELNADSNFALVESALDAARRRLPEPLFILYPGDFLAHDWQATYDGLAPKTIAEDAAAYQAFTTKALTVVAGAFHRRFPETPVLATLGNDDSFCGDYWIQPGGEFLRTFARAWKPLLRKTVEPSAFEQSCNQLGAYSAELPGLSGDRLLVVNSVLWSGSYCSAYHEPAKENCCACKNPGAAPGRAQFDWLEAQLAQAKAQHERVWLLMHVPPGLDSYAEERASGKSRAADMWTPEFTKRYLALIDEYRTTLHASFTGHTHMDDYRVDRVRGEPVLLHKIAPAVSPIFGNNPAFQVFEVETETSLITNWQTQNLNLSATQADSTPAIWSLEYEATTTYGLNDVTARSITSLFKHIEAEPTGDQANAYRKFYTASATPIAEQDLFIFACAVLNATYEEFAECLNQHGLPRPKHIAEPAQLRRAAGGLGEPTRQVERAQRSSAPLEKPSNFRP